MKPEIKISKEDAQNIVNDIKNDVSVFDVDEIIGIKTEESNIQDLALAQAKREIDKWLLVGVMLGHIEYKKEDKKIILKLLKSLKGEEVEKKKITFHVKDIDFGTMKQFESYTSDVEKTIAAMGFITHEHQKILKKLSGNDLYFANSITKLFL